MKRYRLTPEAGEDITSIAEYYHDFRPKYARMLVRKILDRCRLLARFPKSGTDRKGLVPELRSVVVKDHLIFFCPISTGVEIIRVIHGAMDITAKDFE